MVNISMHARVRRHFGVVKTRLITTAFLIGSLSLTGLVGCQHSDTVNPTFDPSTFFARLVLAEHAVTLSTTAPANTVQLHITAEMGDGTTMIPTVHFTKSDSTIDVDSLGRITARFATIFPATVRACVTYNDVTHCDVAMVRVTSGPVPSLDRVALRLPPGAVPGVPVTVRDTLLFAIVPGTLQFSASAIDVGGTPQPDVLIAFQSSDSSVAIIDTTGLVTAVRPGVVTVRATASVYGHTFTDSLRLAVSASQYFGIGADSVPGTGGKTLSWSVDTARVSVGAIVDWANINQYAVATDVHFNDTTGIDSVSFIPPDFPPTGRGNIAAFGGPASPDPNVDVFGFYVQAQPARRFTKVGVYTYTSMNVSKPGVVIVCALTDPCYK